MCFKRDPYDLTYADNRTNEIYNQHTSEDDAISRCEGKDQAGVGVHMFFSERRRPEPEIEQLENE